MRIAVVGVGDGDGLPSRNDWFKQDKPARSLKTIPD